MHFDMHIANRVGLCMLFNKLLNNCQNELHFDIHSVNRVDYVCYLSLTVDCNFSLKFHVNCGIDKIARSLSLLRKCSHFMPGECLRSIYFAFIYPCLQYGIEFWGTASDKYLHKMLILQKLILGKLFSLTILIIVILQLNNRVSCSLTVFINSLFVLLRLKILIMFTPFL